MIQGRRGHEGLMTSNNLQVSWVARVGAPVVLAFTVACPSTPSETTASTDESTSSTTEPTTGSTGESQGTTGEPPVPTTGMSSSTSEGETETTGEPGQA